MRGLISFLGALWLGLAPIASAQTLSGAGATFPFPLYATWAAEYARDTGVKVNYQSIGSGGGIKQTKAGTVDFGASDTPLEPEDLRVSGLVQFPTVLGGVVPVVNLEGVEPGQLKLNAEVLAALFLGEIVTWDDPRIQALNPGLTLPDTRVSVVHRADASGTTWIFTNYLSKVSPTWKERIGNEMAVSWPTGVGGKGNEGVASYVSRIPGAIGYVEFAYALQNKMNVAQLKNQAGRYVAPSQQTFQSAAAQANWDSAPDFFMVLTDQPGAATWPIVGATFILMQRIQKNPQTGKTVLGFFDWAYQNGDAMASELDYVALPDNVVRLIQQYWRNQLRGPTGQPLWTQ